MSAQPSTMARQAKAEGDRAAQSKWVAWLGRAGLAAQGGSYALVGVLALLLAIGKGGQTTSRQGALKTVAHGTGGKILVALLAIGFLGYALWRIADAIFDRRQEGDDAKGLAKRAGSLGRAGIYIALAVSAISILFGGGGGGGGGKKQAAGVLGWPGGQWIVGAAGIVLIGVALWQVYRAYKSKFMDDMNTDEMGPDERDIIERVGQIGWVARAVVFAIIGWFLVKAALDYNANDAVGIGGALSKLANASYGPYLLGVVAAGLVAFGLFCVAQARYRQV